MAFPLLALLFPVMAVAATPGFTLVESAPV